MHFCMATKSQNSLRETFVFKPTVVQGLNESEENRDPRIDGKRIIGKLVGEMFASDATTLNNRYYKRSMWENILKAEADRFPLFGTCGHEVEFNEESIKRGEVTHKITKMWIDEKTGKGMGEILVLGNEYGRNIYDLMAEGYPMAVSTRAYGEVLKGKGPGGSDLIDESSFYFHGIDFVCNPGHRAAFPKVVESESQMGVENKKMDGDFKILVENLNKDNVETKVALNEALAANKALNEKVAAQEKMIVAIQEKFGDDPIQSLNKIEEGLRKWLELEPFKSFAKSTNLFGKTKVPPMQEVLEHLFGISESYAKLGSVDELKEAKELCEKYEEYGNLDEHEKAYIALKGFVDVAGRRTPAQLKSVLEGAEKVISIYKGVKLNSAAKAISGKFKVNEEVVKEMLAKDSAKNVIEHLSKLRKTNESASATPAAANAASRVATGEGGKTVVTKSVEKSGDKLSGLFESIKVADKKQNESTKFLNELTRGRKK